MATSKRLAAVIAALALGLAGCGGASSTTRSNSAATTSSDGSAQAGAFAWLRPAAAPPGWSLARISSGAAMPYPSGWQHIRGDHGTASAALLDSHRRFLGYLNLTPRQSNETLAGWSRFRVEHNAEENDHNVTTLASGTNLRFRGGSDGSCVKDSYTTVARTSYVEIACLIEGKRASVVIVAASPPGMWRQMSPVLEQAISSTEA